jgi:hypothetical protein
MFARADNAISRGGGGCFKKYVKVRFHLFGNLKTNEGLKIAKKAFGKKGYSLSIRFKSLLRRLLVGKNVKASPDTELSSS